MSNIDAVNALITAINFDRFAEIEARHHPDAVFYSFRGPTLRDSVAIADWHREFLRDYADCNYVELEYIEQGDARGGARNDRGEGHTTGGRSPSAWSRCFRFEDEEVVASRKLYGMLRDLELDKPATAAMNAALEVKGGKRKCDALDRRSVLHGLAGGRPGDGRIAPGRRSRAARLGLRHRDGRRRRWSTS